MYNLGYFHVIKTMNVYKIWIKFGIHEQQRHVPVQWLAEIIGTEKLWVLLKAHILIGFDVTNNIRSKLVAFKAYLEKYLYDLGEEFHNYLFQMASK